MDCVKFVTSVPRAPERVAVERVDESSMRVSWSELTPERARGHLIHYTIHYWPASDREMVSKITVPPNTTSVVIRSLRPGVSYVVQVSATNGAGSGERSMEATLASQTAGIIPTQSLYLISSLLQEIYHHQLQLWVPWWVGLLQLYC